MRKLALLLVLAIAPGSLLASVALAVSGSVHAHSPSLIIEDGHLHLVLSHGTAGHAEHAGGHHPEDRGTSTSEPGRDHVLHLIDGSSASSARRAGLDTLPQIATTPGAFAAIRPRHVAHFPPELRARGSSQMRSVVLLL
jgi:hypothetical protein